ncbi:putative transcription factor interactor and regulator CCHC(Zn) family [Helianthus annuus]|nr:putative transcription factor interactor and regulator CCHC(Zn) family [Helianthus annuus]KAJ0907294.1 putative transcription factor interactor and regulator CCHC(Zn) family [Helianthus annuus]
MVTPMDRAIEKYIDGLPNPVQDIVTGSKPARLREAIELAATLTDSQVRKGKLFRKGDKKQTTNENPKETKAEPSKNSKKRKASRNFKIVAPIPLNSVPVRGFYRGRQLRCNRCNYHHQANAPCRQCTICGLFGHLATTCRIQNQAAPTQTHPRYPARGCFNCGDLHHFKRNCSMLANANGRVYNVNEAQANDQELMII